MSAQPGMLVVGETGLGSQAVAMVADTQADVVVLDTALPDANGLTIARELRDRYAGLGIVLLTSNGEDDVLFRALEIGVSAFVPKTAPAAEAVAAMYVSHSTAKTYVARVYEKLGASNRAQALMTALQLGLLRQDLPAPA
ncbi:response regulator transcription factor [Kribbella sp. NPDC050820]|uniref:response regulator transcription factor n=1 Tax=Kribbella sp. NPDC050820 TaxID=3155408 RepID=UPI0033C70CCA